MPLKFTVALGRKVRPLRFGAVTPTTTLCSRCTLLIAQGTLGNLSKSEDSFRSENSLDDLFFDSFLATHWRTTKPNAASHLFSAVSADDNAARSVVPVQILTGYIILIPVTINRFHTHLFILDTGASHTTISKALAHDAGLAAIGKHEIWGAGETSYSVDVNPRNIAGRQRYSYGRLSDG